VTKFQNSVRIGQLSKNQTTQENLAVAPKANDYFAHVSHVHQRTNMAKRGKSKNNKVLKTNSLQEDSKEKFQNLMIEIRKVEEELTNTSKKIDDNLKLLINSTKKSAE
jgi:hypothetical protein